MKDQPNTETVVAGGALGTGRAAAAATCATEVHAALNYLRGDCEAAATGTLVLQVPGQRVHMMMAR